MSIKAQLSYYVYKTVDRISVLSMEKMKLLILSQCFYPSKYRGGSTVSTVNLVKALSGCFDISVITTFYEIGSEKPYTKVSAGKNRILDCDVYYLKNQGLSSVWKLIKTIRPGVIFVSSIFSAMHSIPAMLYQKYTDPDVRLIISPRGELLKEARRLKAWRKNLFLHGIRLTGLTGRAQFHATSREELEELRGIFPGSPIHCIKDISLAGDNPFPRPEKTEGVLHIYTVSRIHPIKNIHMAIEILRNVKGRIRFDIYGPVEDKDYFEACMKKADCLGDNARIRYKGCLDHEGMPELISRYHLFLSPSKNENFGHSIIEAMQYGCPVIISDRTPWQKLEDYHAGYSIPLDRTEEFSRAVQSFADMKNSDYQSWCAGASAYTGEFLDIGKSIEEHKAMFLGSRKTTDATDV